MLFSSLLFLFRFLPLVLAAHFLVPRRARNLLLLLASLFFYAWGEQGVVLVLLLSIAANYGLGLWLAGLGGERAARLPLTLAVVFNLGLLFFYKYASFAVGVLNGALWRVGVPLLPDPGIELPIGISFFTFQALSYVFDLHRGRAEAQRSPIDFGLYVALFPQLIAGPIVRYRDIALQLGRRVVDREGFAYGIRRFVIGLGKKCLIANNVAVASDAIFAVPEGELTAGLAWVGLVAYTLQIYFDFSGYSDMAIGLARMFGFRLLENFEHPYVSTSVTEFWRRWHISLSNWFRDYLYIPLGGNRGTRLQTYRNLILVFALCGLWHGAKWSFLVWGLYHGAFLTLERLGAGGLLPRVPRPLRHAYLLFAVALGWVFFRAADLGHAVTYLQALFGLGAGDGLRHPVALYVNPLILTAMAAGVAGSMPVLPWLQRWTRRLSPRPAQALAAAGDLALVPVLAGSVLLLAAGTHNPFIYFRF